MNLKTSIIILGTVIFIGGAVSFLVFLQSNRVEEGENISMECRSTYQSVGAAQNKTVAKAPVPFEVSIDVENKEALQVGVPFRIQYTFQSQNPYPKATSEVYTFGNISFVGAKVHVKRFGWYVYYGLEEDIERSGIMGALLKIDSLGEGQITYVLQTRPDAQEQNNQNIPYTGSRANLYFLATEEGIFTNTHSPLILKIEHLNTKCNAQKLSQLEYERELKNILSGGISEMPKPSLKELSEASDWETTQHFFEFAHPTGWILRDDSPLFELTDPNNSIIILFQRISFNRFGSTYCGGNYNEPERCEPIEIDGKLGFIDWGLTSGIGDVLVGISEESGWRMTFNSSMNQLDADAKDFFRIFLSNIKFTRISSGTKEHFVRLIAPNTGGDFPCLNKNYIIRWDYKNVNEVMIWVRKRGGTAYEIGRFPAKNNEENKPGFGIYPWSVGKVSGFVFGVSESGKPGPEANKLDVFVFGRLSVVSTLEPGLYEVGIYDVDDIDTYDVSDGTFSIIRCEG